jgi:hypothetical protein
MLRHHPSAGQEEATSKPSVVSLEVSPVDSNQLLAVYSNQLAVVWELQPKKIVKLFKLPSEVTCTCFDYALIANFASPLGIVQ